MILMNTDFQERTPTFPMLVTPLKRPQKTTTHERIRHRQRRHCSVWPSSSWKPSEMSSMKLLLGILAISNKQEQKQRQFWPASDHIGQNQEQTASVHVTRSSEQLWPKMNTYWKYSSAGSFMLSEVSLRSCQSSFDTSLSK